MKKNNAKVGSTLKRQRWLEFGVFMIAFAIVGALFLYKGFAAGEVLYLSPSTGKAQTGSDYTVTLRAAPGSGINSVDATIIYDQSKLMFKSIDTSASAFTADFISEGGNGQVHIVRGVFSTMVTTDSEVAKITFTTLVKTVGTTAMTLTGEVGDGNTSFVPEVRSATLTICDNMRSCKVSRGKNK